MTDQAVTPVAAVGERSSDVRRRRRRRWPWVTAAVLVLTLVALVWIGVLALRARTALTTAMTQVQTLQSGLVADDRLAARTALNELRATTQEARDATSDPVWRVAAAAPWLGANLAAVSTVAVGVDDLADLALPPVLDATRTVGLDALTPVGGRIDLGPIAAAAPLISQASTAAAAVDADLSAVDTRKLLASVAAPVAQAQTAASDLAGLLRTAERATVLLPSMLGADGPRDYLLLMQTNAELRATGGMPGALSVLSADDGRIELTAQSTAAEVHQSEVDDVPLTVEDEALFSHRMGEFMADVNFTPDFPTAAGIARDMWRQHSGQELDGVLAVDPVALSYLLEATGPVDDGVGGVLAAEDAAGMLLSGAYARFPDPTDQNDYFAGVAASVFTSLLSGAADPTSTVPALARAADERRLLVWPTRPEEQAALADTRLTGALPSGPDAVPSVGVFYNDGTASKMSYHLGTAIEAVDVECAGAEATYTVHVSLANTAPLDAATALPASVLGPGTTGVPAGGIRTNVVVLGPQGGGVGSVWRDGGPLGVGAYEYGGRAATALTVELLPGERAVLDIELTGPASGRPLEVWSTPTTNESGWMSSDLLCP